MVKNRRLLDGDLLSPVEWCGNRTVNRQGRAGNHILATFGTQSCEHNRFARVWEGSVRQHLETHTGSYETGGLMAEQFSRASISRGVVDGLRMGRITALQKPNGGVRGIVAGDAIRRLVSRTIAQELRHAVERAAAPHHCAMTTKAGCECIAHVSRCVSLTHRAQYSWMERIRLALSRIYAARFDASGGRRRGSPFVRQFHGHPSQYLWEDDARVTHTIPQGEGGEHVQHSAFEAIQRQLFPSERRLACLDDDDAVTPDPGAGGSDLRLHATRFVGACLVAH